MRRACIIIQLLAIGLCGAQDGIDWNKARDLFQRSQRGEQLSAEDQAYLERARAMRQQRERPGGAPGAPGGGQRQAPERLIPVSDMGGVAGGRGARGGGQRQAPERLIPVSDMGAEDRYEGQEGGLYGGGRNEPTEELRAAAEAELAKIQPVDGKIVFVSISMSNATQEFSQFKRLADASPLKSAGTVVVDCAQGGQAMAEWTSPEARPWEVAMQRLGQAGVKPEQVQVAWVKLANKGPAGTLEQHGKKLESDTVKVLQNAKEKFPNLRVAYLGSRIWAGNGRGNLNPEPYAYESAFVVRWLIQRQMAGDADVALGKAPLLLWGPYLWAEGEKGRKMDGLVWLREDFAGDGVHPSPSGREKVARLLLDFVTTDPLAKPWFVME